MPLLEIRQDSDCEICESENDSDGEDFEESSLHDDGMKRSDYTLLTTWVTGDKATLEEEDIQMELFDITRSWMSASLFKLFKMRCRVDDPQDFALWKCFRPYSSRSGSHSIRLFPLPCVLFVQMQC